MGCQKETRQTSATQPFFFSAGKFLSARLPHIPACSFPANEQPVDCEKALTLPPKKVGPSPNVRNKGEKKEHKGRADLFLCLSVADNSWRCTTTPPAPTRPPTSTRRPRGTLRVRGRSSRRFSRRRRRQPLPAAAAAAAAARRPSGNWARSSPSPRTTLWPAAFWRATAAGPSSWTLPPTAPSPASDSSKSKPERE